MSIWQQKSSKSSLWCTAVAALFTYACVHNIYYILFPKREKATRTRTVNARLTCVGCSGVRCWRNPRSLGGGPSLYYRKHTHTCLALYNNYKASPSKKKNENVHYERIYYFIIYLFSYFKNIYELDCVLFNFLN